MNEHERSQVELFLEKSISKINRSERAFVKMVIFVYNDKDLSDEDAALITRASLKFERLKDLNKRRAEGVSKSWERGDRDEWKEEARLAKLKREVFTKKIKVSKRPGVYQGGAPGTGKRR